MRDEERLEILLARAQAETAPQVDIVERVMAALSCAPPNVRQKTDPLLWVAVPSAAAAIVALCATLTGGDGWADVLMAAVSDLPWWML